MANEGRSQKMRREFTELRQAIANDLDERFKAQSDDIEHRLRVNFEDLRDLVTKAAEGYGGTLEGIQRELADMNEKFDTKRSDHDKVFANHNQRLLVLEHRRNGRRTKPRG